MRRKPSEISPFPDPTLTQTQPKRKSHQKFHRPRRSFSLEPYDVAIIGAGPAGVMAAWSASKQGARTILLEKEPNPGRKPCAEGILSEVLNDAEVSPNPEFALNHISGAVLYAPDEKKRVDVGGEGYILDKPAFLKHLALRAQSTGAEMAYGTSIESISRNNGY